MAIKTADDGKNNERRICNEPNWAIIQVAVDSATVIHIGDLLWLDTDDAKPASDVPWNTDEASTRADFIAKFLGVAKSASADGETEDVKVYTIGKFFFDIKAAPAADLQVGTLMGPAKAAGDALLNQVLHNAATVKGAGTLAKPCKTTDDEPCVQLRGHYVPPPAS